VTVIAVTVIAVTVIAVTVIAVTVIAVTVIAVTVIAVTVIAVTANGAVEVILFADMTATPETGLQHLRRFSSHLSGAETTETGIVLEMLGPGGLQSLCYQYCSYHS
jgi:hypothetical protein